MAVSVIDTRREFKLVPYSGDDEYWPQWVLKFEAWSELVGWGRHLDLTRVMVSWMCLESGTSVLCGHCVLSHDGLARLILCILSTAVRAYVRTASGSSCCGQFRAALRTVPILSRLSQENYGTLHTQVATDSLTFASRKECRTTSGLAFA